MHQLHAMSMREDLDQFPIVDDFSVTLIDSEDSGKQLEYTSASRGRLAHFPAWEHVDRDLRHFIPADVPLGTRDEPYDDRDEGWRIVIFEEAGWVYVAEGDDPNATEFASTFRVRRDRYIREWATLIDAFNPISPLDEQSSSETIQ